MRIFMGMSMPMLTHACLYTCPCPYTCLCTCPYACLCACVDTCFYGHQVQQSGKSGLLRSVSLVQLKHIYVHANFDPQRAGWEEHDMYPTPTPICY